MKVKKKEREKNGNDYATTQARVSSDDDDNFGSCCFNIRIVSLVRSFIWSVGWSVVCLLTHSLVFFPLMLFFFRFIFVCLHDGITDAFNPHMYIASK